MARAHLCRQLRHTRLPGRRVPHYRHSLSRNARPPRWARARPTRHRALLGHFRAHGWGFPGALLRTCSDVVGTEEGVLVGRSGICARVWDVPACECICSGGREGRWEMGSDGLGDDGVHVAVRVHYGDGVWCVVPCSVSPSLSPPVAPSHMT
jgi:hypothetical protein